MQASNRRRRLLASRSAGHLGLHFPPCRIRFCRAAFMLRVQQGFARLRAGRVAALTCHWHVIHYRSHRIPAYTILKMFPLPLAGGNIFGAPAGIRTLDTRLKRAVLYLLSYWGKYINFFRAPRESEESYRRGWDGGTRTHYIGVKVRCVTITLHPSIIN